MIKAANAERAVSRIFISTSLRPNSFGDYNLNDFKAFERVFIWIGKHRWTFTVVVQCSANAPVHC